MKLKITLFLSLFFICLTSFGQFKPSLPEPSIIRPQIILPESQINDYARSYNKKIRKTIIDKVITEFDKNGNIIKKTTVLGPSTNIVVCTYKNNVLIETIDSTVTNSAEVKKENANLIRESKRQNADFDAIPQYDDNVPTYIYKALLDKNNRVISYTFEQKKAGADKRENFVHQTNILYNKDKVTDITTNDIAKEHYSYDKNFLVKKETILVNGKFKSLKSTQYNYDIKNNLIRIKYNAEESYDGKVRNHDNYVNDSAVYNNKNQLIWAGVKRQFMTYKYDNNNNITEFCQYNDGKEYSKDEYFYKNKQLIKNIKTTNHGPNKEKFVVITNYNYNEGKLAGIKKITPTLTLDNEVIYEYDENNHLKKSIEKNTYSNKTNENKQISNTVTNFNYNKNTLTIESQYGDVKKYEFYE